MKTLDQSAYCNFTDWLVQHDSIENLSEGLKENLESCMEGHRSLSGTPVYVIPLGEKAVRLPVRFDRNIVQVSHPEDIEASMQVGSIHRANYFSQVLMNVILQKTFHTREWEAHTHDKYQIREGIGRNACKKTGLDDLMGYHNVVPLSSMVDMQLAGDSESGFSCLMMRGSAVIETRKDATHINHTQRGRATVTHGEGSQATLVTLRMRTNFTGKQPRNMARFIGRLEEQVQEHLNRWINRNVHHLIHEVFSFRYEHFCEAMVFVTNPQDYLVFNPAGGINLTVIVRG